MIDSAPKLLDIYTSLLSGTVGSARATKAGRLGSVPVRVTPKTWKTVPASCSALMDGCKEAIHAHWLAIRAPLTAKVVVWPTAQASGYGRRRPLVTLQSSTQTNINITGWTELTWIRDQYHSRSWRTCVHGCFSDSAASKHE